MAASRKVVWILDQQKSEYLDAQPLLATRGVDLLVLSGNLGVGACRSSSEKAVELFGLPQLVMVAEGFSDCWQEIANGFHALPDLWELKSPSALDQDTFVKGAQPVPSFKNATDLITRLVNPEIKPSRTRPVLGRTRRRFTATYNGRSVQLTPREYEIIATLAASPSFAHTRADMRNLVWKNIKVCNKVLDVHVSNVRKKLLKLGFTIQFQRPETYALIAIEVSGIDSDQEAVLPRPTLIELLMNTRSA